MKEEQASDFILSMRQDRETSIPLGIDPALLLAAKRGKGRLSAGFLAACIATMMLPLKQCAVIAGNGAIMRVRSLSTASSPLSQYVMSQQMSTIHECHGSPQDERRKGCGVVWCIGMLLVALRSIDILSLHD